MEELSSHHRIHKFQWCSIQTKQDHLSQHSNNTHGIPIKVQGDKTRSGSLLAMNLHNRTAEERRRPTLCYEQRDNGYIYVQILLCSVFFLLPSCCISSLLITHMCWITLGLYVKARPSAKPLIWKAFFVIMQIKPIFTRKVCTLARTFESESFWNSEMA